MPLSSDFSKIKTRFLKEYGPEGEGHFYAWLGKHGFDESQPFKVKSGGRHFVFTDGISLKEESGEFYVEGIISTNSFDKQNEMVTSNALSRMVEQIKSGSVKLGYEHKEYLSGHPAIVPCGRFVDAEVKELADGTSGVWARAILNRHSATWNELEGSIKNGFLDAFSIEFVPTKRIGMPNGSIITDDLDFYGVALTGRPANPEAVLDNWYVKSLSWVDELANSETPSQELLEKFKAESLPDFQFNTDSLNTVSEVKAHNSDYRGPEHEEMRGEQDDDSAKKKKKQGEMMEEKAEAIVVETKSENQLDVKALRDAVREEIKAAMKAESPRLEANQSQFSQTQIQEHPIVKSYEDAVWGRINSGERITRDDVDRMWAAAGQLHSFVANSGIHQRSANGDGGYRHASVIGISGKSTGYQIGETDDGRAITSSWGQDFTYKSRPAMSFKAQTEHDTNKVSNTTYYQNAAELSDIYGPVLVAHMNDKTTLWGVLRKVDAGSYGDRFGVRAETSNPSAGSYDESATDEPSGTSTTRLKLQIPFLMYRAVPQVSGLMMAAGTSGIGDIFSAEVRRHTAALLRDINEDLFGTANGMTLGSAILGLQYLVDNGDNYTTLYGHTRTSGNFTTLQGNLQAKSGSPRIDFETLRTSIRACEKNGAEREDLIIVCDHIQRDFILGKMDSQQRNLTEQARAGFVGLPTFDGVPIFADDQATDTIVWVINTRHTYIVVKQPVVMEELARNGDYRKAQIKVYFNLFSDAPNRNAMITGLAST